MSFLPLQIVSEDIVLCQRCKSSITAPKSAPEAIQKIRDIHIPTPTEANHISKLMLEAQVDLARFSQTIYSLRSLLAKLERQRESVRTSIKMYRCLQAPVRRLPTETLADIFHHCRTQTRSNLGSYPEYLTDTEGLAALNLGLVCRRWREIALSLPKLWTTISLDLDEMWNPEEYDLDEEMVLQLKPILQAYLHRSREHTLTIHLSATESFPYPRIPEIITDVISESHRWRNLTLDLQCDISESYSFDALKGPEGFLALEDLKILGDDFPYDYMTFRNCPQLQTLTLSALAEGSASLRDFPHSQIQVLRLEGSDIALFRLIDCVQLVRLEIDSGFGFSCNVDEHIESHVQFLSLSVYSPGPQSRQPRHVAAMLDKLTFPSLRYFRINGTRRLVAKFIYIADVWASALSSFLSRSECPLETLYIEDMKMAPEDLLSILTSAPRTLSTLRLHELITVRPPENDKTPVVTDSILQSLTYDPETLDLPLLPRLTHFDYSPHPSVNDETLLAMIESRWSPTAIHSNGSCGVACLESVALISKRHPFGPSIIDRLGRLGKEGLEVTVDGQDITCVTSFIAVAG